MDQVQDTNQRELYQLSTVLDFPEFVKQASQPTTSDVAGLPSRAFADQTNRRFPFHDRANTWLSMAYFSKCAGDYSAQDRAVVARNLATAAHMWKIDLPTMRPMEKQASTGIRIQYRIGDQTHDEATVTTADELLKVAQDAIDSPQRYPWQMRRDVCRQALNAAPVLKAQFSAPMHVLLEKGAGNGVGALDDALEAIQQRQSVVRNSRPELIEPLEHLKGHCKTAARRGLLSGDMLDKTAGMLDAVDRLVGAHKKYSPGFQPPERKLYGTTMSQVDGFNKQAVQIPSGQLVPRDLLCTEGTRRYIGIFLGQKCASVEEVPEVVCRMDTRTSQLVYNHLQETA